MDGETLSQVEMQEISAIEKDGEVSNIYIDRLRKTESYKQAVSFWQSPAGIEAIKRSRN